MRRRILLTIFSLLLIGTGIAYQGSASAQSSCTIPDSGPWPPCATNGGTAAPANNNDCVIPSSGPWPPCAANGGATSGNTTENSSNECIIPPSGPWPPCASSGGGTSTPANNNECVIPTSGPWPPCATSGTATAQPAQPTRPVTRPPIQPNNTARQQQYTLLQARDLFLLILNTDIANESVTPGSLLIPATWDAESEVALQNNRMFIISRQPDESQHRLVAHLGAQGGRPTLTLEQLDINDEAVSEEVQRAYEQRILNHLTKRLQDGLNYVSVDAISAENDILRIDYSVKPTSFTRTYNAFETRNLFTTILNVDAAKRFGNWQPDTEITLQHRKITLNSTFWDGTQTQRLALVARLGLANGEPLVGLERLTFNGQDAAPWDRTSAELLLETNLAKRIRAELGKDIVIVSIVAADDTMSVTYR